MGAGNFFAGLLGGYTGTMLRDEDREYKQEMAAREMRMKTAIMGLEDAVKTGDQNAIQAATKNVDDSMQAIREPFQRQKKQKRQQESPHSGLLQKIVQGMTHHAQQQQLWNELPPATAQQIGGGPSLGPVPRLQGQGGSPQLMPAPTGQEPKETPLSQASGTPQAGAAASPSDAPASLPPVPMSPLQMAYAAYPNKVQQASTEGKAVVAETDSMTKGFVDQQEKILGRPLTTDEKLHIQESVSGLLPKLMSQGYHPATGAYISGDQLPDGAIGLDGNPIPASGRVKSIHYTAMLRPGAPTLYYPTKDAGTGAGESTSQTGIYETRGGKSVPAFRSPKSGKIVDTAGNTLSGGTFVPTAQMPTSSSGSAFQVVSGPNGEPQLVQVPVQRVSQKVAPGQALPPLPQKGEIRGLGPKPEPLTGQAKQAIENVQFGMGMADRVQQALQSAGIASEGGFLSQAKMAEEYAKYKLRRPLDPPYDTLIPTIAQLRVVLTTPYLRGLRNYNWVEQIGIHLPQPYDPPQRIIQNLNQLRENLPMLVNAIKETEQPGIRQNEAKSPVKKLRYDPSTGTLVGR